MWLYSLMYEIHCKMELVCHKWHFRLHIITSEMYSESKKLWQIFAITWLTTDRQTDWPTDRPRYSVCNNRPHPAGAVMQPKNLSDDVLAWLSVWRKVQMICIWSRWCHCRSIISCFIKIQTGLTFLVPAYSGCYDQERFAHNTMKHFPPHPVFLNYLVKVGTPGIVAIFAIICSDLQFCFVTRLAHILLPFTSFYYQGKNAHLRWIKQQLIEISSVWTVEQCGTNDCLPACTCVRYRHYEHHCDL